LTESLVHRCILHAERGTLAFWRRHRRLFRVFLRARHAHRSHHSRAARYGDPEQAQQRTPESIAADVRALRHQPGGVVFFLTPLLLVCVVSVWLGPWALVAALPSIAAYPAVALLVHPYLHLRRSQISMVAGPATTWLFGTAPFRWLAQYHAAHHRYPGRNHNLLAGADQLFDILSRLGQASRWPGSNDDRAAASRRERTGRRRRGANGEESRP
jgi:hypothetical protein